MNHSEYPQKYLKPYADQYHPEVYKDTRLKKSAPPLRFWADLSKGFPPDPSKPENQYTVVWRTSCGNQISPSCYD